MLKQAWRNSHKSRYGKVLNFHPILCPATLPLMSLQMKNPLYITCCDSHPLQKDLWHEELRRLPEGDHL
jgi:hypothetical protein